MTISKPAASEIGNAIHFSTASTISFELLLAAMDADEIVLGYYQQKCNNLGSLTIDSCCKQQHEEQTKPKEKK